MAKKDKEQSERIIKKAEELGSDESGERFEKSFGRIVKGKREIPPQQTPESKPKG